jgi:hypothetical protein
MRIWEERIKRIAHQQLHLSVLTIVNTLYKYFGIRIVMPFFRVLTRNIIRRKYVILQPKPSYL